MKLYLLTTMMVVGSGVAWGQSYLGLDGGLEGSATVENSTTSSVGQSGKWSKNNANTSILKESTTKRSGQYSIKLNNSSSTGYRCITPTFSPTSGQRLVIQYYRLVTSNPNSQGSHCDVSRNGSLSSVAAQSPTYTMPTSNSTWEKVEFAPTSTDFVTNIFACILHKKTGTGGDLYIDDLCIYTATAVDNSAPNSPTAPIIGSATASSLNIAWTAASGGVDNGGYLVVRGTADPTTAPNLNGIYAVGNTIGSGTVVYQGTGTSFTDTGLSSGVTYYYRIYTYDKAYNYSAALTGNAAIISPEPTNHVTGFDGVGLENTLLFEWVNATGAQTPDGYLIKGSNISFEAITAPADGITEVDGGLVKNVTDGNHSATFTELNAGSTYYFKIFPYTNSGSAIDYKLDGTVPQATATTENLYFRSKATGNWSATSSWEKSTDGNAWADATVAPSNAATSVTIQIGHHITVTANATSPSLTLAPTAQLTLNNGNNLAITGNFTIQSDANGTATLVDANAAGGLSVSGGTTSVQQYLATGRNWYISSPVASAPRNVFSTAATHLYEFNETTGSVDGTWQELTIDATALGVGQGYVARIENAGTVTFTGGNLNTGTISLTDLSVNSGDYAGFHLIGNPYPSFLDWDQAPRSNMMSSVWFRTRDNASTPAYVFDTYGVRTGEGTNNNGRGTVSKDIPPMQAFWTRANSSTNGIQFTNAMRSHQSQTEDKRLRTRAQENQQVIRLEVKNNQHSDEAILVFNSDASDGFDDFDSPKKSNNNVAIPEIYTMAGNEQVAINGMQNIVLNREIALGFKTGTANDFTLRTSAIRNLSNDIVVFLKDRLRGTEVQLTPETAYSFSSDTTNTNQRFSIIFRSSTVITGVDQIVAQTVAYINKNHQIVVNHKGFNEGMITVTNALGQELLRQKTEMNCTTINKTLSAGVYFVSLQNSLKKVSRKVIIN